MTARTFRLLVVLAVLAGLAVRLASVLGRPHLVAGGDPGEYLGQANLLADGRGWIEPYVYANTGVAQQTAKLPPLWTMLMTLCSLVGWKSFFAHRIWSALISTAGVGVAAGLGREVAGRAVGVATAVGVALSPDIWMSAGLLMSETVSVVMVMVVLWASYRMWRSPTMARVVWLGLAIGFAALARDEMLVFAVAILVPVVLLRVRPRRQQLRLVGAGLAASVLVVAPWVGFNLSRFSHPVLISDRFGVTLAAANCDDSWHGPLRGYWSMGCALRSVATVHGDESAGDPVATRVGLHYIGSHIGGMAAIEYDRLGRTFGFWSVSNQLALDHYVESRPQPWVDVGAGTYYALLILAPFGVVALRRRGVAVFPLAAVLLDVVLVTVITYGQTRFRATLEPVLVLLGSVALCGRADQWWTTRRGGSVAAPVREASGRSAT